MGRGAKSERARLRSFGRYRETIRRGRCIGGGGGGGGGGGDSQWMENVSGDQVESTGNSYNGGATPPQGEQSGGPSVEDMLREKKRRGAFGQQNQYAGNNNQY